MNIILIVSFLIASFQTTREAFIGLCLNYSRFKPSNIPRFRLPQNQSCYFPSPAGKPSPPAYILLQVRLQLPEPLACFLITEAQICFRVVAEEIRQVFHLYLRISRHFQQLRNQRGQTLVNRRHRVLHPLEG
jgi:hypothetical protein